MFLIWFIFSIWFIFKIVCSITITKFLEITNIKALEMCTQYITVNHRWRQHYREEIEILYITPFRKYVENYSFRDSFKSHSIENFYPHYIIASWPKWKMDPKLVQQTISHATR